MDTLPALASVFGVAFLSLWASIPAGIALRLGAVAIVVTATLAYAAGVALVVLPGQKVRDWLMAKLGKRAELNADSLVGRIWNRFGLVGLALAAPITTGAQIGALIGLALNVPPRRLLLALTAGGFLWAAVLTVAISLGIVGATGR